MKKLSVGLLARLALLVALDVILTRVLTVLNSAYLKVGVGFLPVALAGMLYGPVCGLVCGALGDAIGALLFPVGDFFIGFTITAGLSGACFGLLLHKNAGCKNVLAVILTNCVGVSLCANTFLLVWWFNVSLAAVLPSRLVQAGITACAYCLLLPLLKKALIPRLEKARLI